MKRMNIALFLLACALLSGCTMFRKPDGSTVSAPDPAKIDAGVQTAAAVVTTTVPPPWGELAAAALVAVGGMVAAHYRGKEKGWTEATGSPAIPAQATLKT